MPLVSVILPNYNYARYLKERVRSILNQSVTDLELLYLDDASTDESNEVMAQFAGDDRVKLYPFDQNSGQVYKRWNDGAAMAQGDFLWFAGADDTAAPNFLEELLPLLSDDSVALVHCSQVFIDGMGRLLSLENPYFADTPVAERLRKDYKASAAEELPILTAQCYIKTASMALIRRSAFEAVGGFDSNVRSSADWLLYLMLVCGGGSVAYSSQHLGAYRVHTETVTSNTKSQSFRIEWAYCLSRVYEQMENFPELHALRPQLWRRIKSYLFDATADGFPIPSNLSSATNYVRQIIEH